jgi:hypothetical protein
MLSDFKLPSVCADSVIIYVYRHKLSQRMSGTTEENHENIRTSD